MPRPKPPLEEDEQAAFITWVEAAEYMQTDELKRLALHWTYHNSNFNEGFVHRSPWQKAHNRPSIAMLKLIAIGHKAGVADIFIPYPKLIAKPVYAGLYIEFKRYGRKLDDDNQIAFAKAMSQLGYKVLSPAYFWQEAARFTVEYMELEKYPPIYEPLYIRILAEYEKEKANKRKVK